MPSTASRTSLFERVASVCGESFVSTDLWALPKYSLDNVEAHQFRADILVKPGTPDEVAAVVKVCYELGVPVTAIGGGSGVTGAAIPIKGGVLLSLERLNRIIEIDQVDRLVVAESGVVTEDLCRAVIDQGLYFPVAPSSSAISFIGGNVAVNAGSIRSCKYGKTAAYVLNLEVVLPTGELIWTGANVAKTSTGFNLSQLFIGTEGTMGIITKVVYRLLPLPSHRILILAAFGSLHDACTTIADIRQSNASPSAVELITENAIRFTAAWLNTVSPYTKEHVKAHLLVEFEAGHDQALSDALEGIRPLLETRAIEDILVATSDWEREALSKLRMSIGNAMTSGDFSYRDVDIAVPIRSLYNFIRQVEDICRQNNVSIACFGHAADGNVHTMLYGKNSAGYRKSSMFKDTLMQIYSCAITMGGVISGEHGIGALQKDFLPLQYTETHMRLLLDIKRVLDPKGLFNPGKLI